MLPPDLPPLASAVEIKLLHDVVPFRLRATSSALRLTLHSMRVYGHRLSESGTLTPSSAPPALGIAGGTSPSGKRKPLPGCRVSAGSGLSPFVSCPPAEVKRAAASNQSPIKHPRYVPLTIFSPVPTKVGINDGRSKIGRRYRSCLLSCARIHFALMS